MNEHIIQGAFLNRVVLLCGRDKGQRAQTFTTLDPQV